MRRFNPGGIAEPCVIASVVLSWGRPRMLRRTVESLRRETTCGHRIAVVDNGSDDETVAEIGRLIGAGWVDSAWLFEQNIGGLAFNPAISSLRAEYVHFSENDLEYRPGWDVGLRAKLAAVPQLGQLSVLGASPERELGEVWVDHAGELMAIGSSSVTVTAGNVGTSSLVRSDLVRGGLRWGNVVSGPFRWPNDGAFSSEIRSRGALVAWNDRYVATNWGHNIEQWREDPGYYLEAYRRKRWIGLDGLRERMAAAGVAVPEAESAAAMTARGFRY